jgi:hypothetical protein
MAEESDAERLAALLANAARAPKTLSLSQKAADGTEYRGGATFAGPSVGVQGGLGMNFGGGRLDFDANYNRAPQARPQFGAKIGFTKKFAKGGAAEDFIPHDDPRRLQNLEQWGAAKDEDGTPKRFFHNSNRSFSAFDTKRSELGAHFGTANQAANIKENQDNPLGGRQTYGVHLNIQNPLRLRDEKDFSSEGVASQLYDMGIINEKLYDKLVTGDYRSEEAAQKAAQNAIMKAGYDGVVYLNRHEGLNQHPDPEENEKRLFWHYAMSTRVNDDEFKQKFPEAEDSYIAFRPNNIKSAIGNNGNFDPEEDDMNKARGGAVDDAAQGLLDQGGSEDRDDYRSQFTQDVYHGTQKDFPEFQVDSGQYSLSRGLGVHVAKDPAVSSSEYFTARGGDNTGANVKPLRTLPDHKFFPVEQKLLPYLEEGTERAPHTVESDDRSVAREILAHAYEADAVRGGDLLKKELRRQRRMSDDEAEESVMKLLSGHPIDNGSTKANSIRHLVDNYYMVPYEDQDRKWAIRSFQNHLRSKGYAGVKYLNTSPNETKGVEDPTCYIVFPRTTEKGDYPLRGRFAKFDPEKRGEPDLMSNKGGRIRRYTGGRIPEMDKRFKDAKKIIDGQTKEILKVPDDVVARALKIAATKF